MKKIEYIFIALFTVFILSFFYNKGFSTADEGYILHAAQRLHEGELPYRDFNFIYTPGSLYLISAAYTFFGESILSGRLLVVITATITSLLLCSISYQLSKNKLAAILSVLTYLAWAPSHISFPLPVIFCIFTGLISFYIFIKTMQNQKKLLYFTLGLSVALTFFFKQNFGLALIGEYSILLLFFKVFRRKSINYFLGLLLGLGLYFLYLFFTKSTNVFFSYSSYAFQEYFIRRTIIAPFPYDPSMPIASLLKLILYLLPPILSISVLFYYLCKKNGIIFIGGALFVGSYYLFGIYPSTDFVHISPLLSLLGLSLASAIAIRRPILTMLTYTLLIVIIVTGFYTAIFKGFYKWSPPITQDIYYLNHQRMKVWANNKEFEDLTNYIQNNTSRNDYIYFYLYQPLLYFVSDRKNPIRYLDSFIPDKKLQEEYIYSIESKNTKLIISGTPVNTWFKDSLSAYILHNYTKKSTFGGYTVWNRNK